MTLNLRDEAIRRLAEGFAEDFVEEVAGDERFHELIQDIAEEYVSKNIPITDEDAHYDVAFELCMRCTTKRV